MKIYIVVLAVMLAMVSTAFSTVNGCGDPATCDYNSLNQVNTANAESGHAVACTGDCTPDQSGLTTTQTQTNCAAVMGAGNTVSQSNNANALGTSLNQVQNNIAMVVGSSNFASQTNNALETGMDANSPFGIYENQNQKNLMLIIGTNNHAEQGNSAAAYSNSGITTAYPISQTQTNVGLLLGDKNWVVQGNTATADMFKLINVDPQIIQTQKNIAFAINNCNEPLVNNNFAGTTSVAWPTVTDPAPVMPWIPCSDCGQ
jgi:hypothetical protein